MYCRATAAVGGQRPPDRFVRSQSYPRHRRLRLRIAIPDTVAHLLGFCVAFDVSMQWYISVTIAHTMDTFAMIKLAQFSLQSYHALGSYEAFNYL